MFDVRIEKGVEIPVDSAYKLKRIVVYRNQIDWLQLGKDGCADMIAVMSMPRSMSGHFGYLKHRGVHRGMTVMNGETAVALHQRSRCLLHHELLASLKGLLLHQCLSFVGQSNDIMATDCVQRCCYFFHLECYWSQSASERIPSNDCIDNNIFGCRAIICDPNYGRYRGFGIAGLSQSWIQNWGSRPGDFVTEDSLQLSPCRTNVTPCYQMVLRLSPLLLFGMEFWLE